MSISKIVVQYYSLSVRIKNEIEIESLNGSYEETSFIRTFLLTLAVEAKR